MKLLKTLAIVLGGATLLAAPAFAGGGGTPTTGLVLADFNGDGETDVLWRNPGSSLISVWTLVDGVRTGAGTLGDPGATWAIAGAGKIDSDENSDVVWYNTTTGQVVVWFMNGTARSSASTIPGPGAGWSVVAVGDLSGDDRADLVLRNTNGTVATWILDGTTKTATGVIGNAATGTFDVEGIGYFNSGTPTLAFVVFRQQASGALSQWALDAAGTARTGTGALPSRPTSQALGAIFDTNDDGNSDLAWQDTGTGAVSVVQLNNTAIAGQKTINASITNATVLLGSGQFGGLPNQDLFLRNGTTGISSLWLMAGLSRESSTVLSNNPNTSWQFATNP